MWLDLGIGSRWCPPLCGFIHDPLQEFNHLRLYILHFSKFWHHLGMEYSSSPNVDSLFLQILIACVSYFTPFVLLSLWALTSCVPHIVNLSPTPFQTKNYFIHISFSLSYYPLLFPFYWLAEFYTTILWNVLSMDRGYTSYCKGSPYPTILEPHCTICTWDTGRLVEVPPQGHCWCFVKKKVIFCILIQLRAYLINQN